MVIQVSYTSEFTFKIAYSISSAIRSITNRCTGLILGRSESRWVGTFSGGAIDHKIVCSSKNPARAKTGVGTKKSAHEASTGKIARPLPKNWVGPFDPGSFKPTIFYYRFLTVEGAQVPLGMQNNIRESHHQ